MHDAVTRRCIGERTIRMRSATEQTRAQADARRLQRQLAERRKRLWGMAADVLCVAAGGAGLLFVQGLWAGRLAETLTGAVLAMGCWAAVGMIREA